MKTSIHFGSYLSQFSLEWKMFQTEIVEKIRKHFMLSNFMKIVVLWDNLEKYCRAVEATDDNVTPAHCMLDSQGYRHTLRICNTYWFSTATMVARTHLSVTFIHTLPVLLHLCMWQKGVLTNVDASDWQKNLVVVLWKATDKTCSM